MINLFEEVIKIIKNKYPNIKLKKDKDKLILKIYQYAKPYYLYAELVIEQYNDNILKITTLPEYIEEVANLERLDEILSILIKQSRFKGFSKDEIEQIKQQYPKGTKIKLVKLQEIRPKASPNSIGIVESINKVGTLKIRSEYGNIFYLVDGIDEFIVI